jgi:hypothetical protein
VDSAAMVSAVQAGGVDVSSADALTLLNSVYQAAVAGGRWLVSEFSLGNTVAGTATVSLPANVVEVDGLKVGGAPYRRVGTRESWQLTYATGPDALYLSPGIPGVFAPDFDSAGAQLVSLWPVPTSVVAVTALAVLEPTALTGAGGNNTVLPADLDPRLVDAAINLGKARVNGDLQAGQAAQQQQDDLSQALQRRRNSRVGSGVAVIDTSGL